MAVMEALCTQSIIISRLSVAPPPLYHGKPCHLMVRQVLKRYLKCKMEAPEAYHLAKGSEMPWGGAGPPSLEHGRCKRSARSMRIFHLGAAQPPRTPCMSWGALGVNEARIPSVMVVFGAQIS
jgi:hypothetical protein